MPQNPVLIYAKDDGTPTYMHTVDAAEAVRLGDYTSAPPDKEVSPEARASAMSRFKTGQATTHPELQTEEEKASTRQAANEDAALLAGLPPGTPVVVQAPSERPAARAAQQAAHQASERSTSSSHTGTASSASTPRRGASEPEEKK